MVRLAAALLVIYNLLFFWERHLPDLLPGFIGAANNFMIEFRGFLTVLELIGVVALFVDLLTTFDKRTDFMRRKLWTLLVALLVVGFLFKVFINYLDSAFLEEGASRLGRIRSRLG